MLTPGQASDLDGFDDLAETIQSEVVIADKGYDADKRECGWYLLPRAGRR